MEALVLRFEAPLMSFGGVVIDQINPTREYPGRAMLAGLLGNALGYEHRDAEALGALQARLAWAAREDRPGKPFVDYHTVNLTAEHMTQGWTTRGQPETRKGGDSSTLIRFRHYLADAVYIVAVTLASGDGPDLAALDAAVKRPARPLFLGRKCCLPSTPLRYARVEAPRLRDVLVHPDVPQVRRAGKTGSKAETPRRLKAWWPIEEGTEIGRTIAFTDDMDWRNQLHVGRRYVQEAWVTLDDPTDKKDPTA